MPKKSDKLKKEIDAVIKKLKAKDAINKSVEKTLNSHKLRNNVKILTSIDLKSIDVIFIHLKNEKICKSLTSI